MPPDGRSLRRSSDRINGGSRPYISDRAASKTQGRMFGTDGRRQRPSLASKAENTRSLRKAVVATAKAVDGLKEREFGYWQTTNSVLSGATADQHRGEAYNDLDASSPVLLHLNNLHSTNGTPPPGWETSNVPTNHDENYGHSHLLRADPTEEVEADGLVRKFIKPKHFSVNGVMQKPKRSGPHLWPMVPNNNPKEQALSATALARDTVMIPTPNGRKIRWGGVDLEIRVEGALQDTQFDFYVVKCNKEAPMAWDPWHQTIPTTARTVPGVLPYTIKDFDHIHADMYPKKLNTDRYTVLNHKRMWVNNVNRFTGQDGHNPVLTDNQKYAMGNTWSQIPGATGLGLDSWGQPTHPATTAMTQQCNISYKPNKIMRPLRNFVGERLDHTLESRGSFADANPHEPATLGTMSWDNFHPSANVWLVMTTTHNRIETPKLEGNANQLYWADWSAANKSGTTIREDQLTWHIKQYPTDTKNLAPDGWVYLEHKALKDARLELDNFRNPRIRIFRRCWWQDEHIPTILGSAYRLSVDQAEIKPTITNTASNNMGTAITPERAKSIFIRLVQHMKYFWGLKQMYKDSSAHNVAGGNPSAWTGLNQNEVDILSDFSELATIAWHQLQGIPGNPLQLVHDALNHRVQQYPPNAVEDLGILYSTADYALNPTPH